MNLTRLFQLRLRTVLAIMLVIAIAAAWYGRKWREEFRRNSAITYLTNRGAVVRMIPSLQGTMADVSFHEAKMTAPASTAPASNSNAAAPAQAAPKLTLEDFEQLRLVPHLTAISIEGDLLSAETLGEIGTLDSLERLEFSHCPIEDAGLQQLASLTKLRELNLEATQVTDEGVARLCEKLPNLIVTDD
jgi:hypothetical protein